MMKPSKIISLFSVFLAIVICAGSNAATTEKSIREQLVNIENVEDLWALDSFVSVVSLKKKGSGAAKKEAVLDLVNAMKKWGTIQVKAIVTDEISEEKKTKWVTITEITDERYKHPVTGRTITFFKDKKYYYRVEGVFEVFNYMTFRASTLGGGVNITVTQILIEHESPQPDISKSKKVKMDNIPSLKPGKFKPGTLSRGFGKGWEPADLMMVLNANNSKMNGKSTWIKQAANQSGWMEINPLEAYLYIQTTPEERIKWLYLSDNENQPFTVKNTAGKITVFHEKPELKYLSLKERGSTSADVIGSGKDITKASERYMQRLALSSAQAKSDQFDTATPTDHYEVYYNGTMDDGCSHITAKHYYINGSPSNFKKLLETNDYLVCNGQVKAVPYIIPGVTPVEVTSLIPKVAKSVQKEGRGLGSYMNYKVIGRPVRDESKCNVQIDIFKGMNLIESKSVDGCNI